MSRVLGTYSQRRTRVSGGLGKLQVCAVPEPTRRLAGQHHAYLSESGCSIIVALEPAKAAPAGIWLPPDELVLWHLSIAHTHRYPTWDEVADARYALIPDEVTMAMLLPPSGR